MGKKSKSSSSSQTYTPSPEERALQKQALEYSKYVMPNAKRLNDSAANILYDSLGDTKVDYNDLMTNAMDQIKWGQQGLRGLAQGQIPAAYQDAMEASIKKGVQGSMGNLLQDMGARGVVNSSIMDTGLKGISDSASDAMAQNWQNTVSQLANIYGQNIDAAGQPIATAAAAQEGAQQPALNLWNASLGLNGATTGALSSLAGKGTTTTTQKTSGGGLFGGILTGLASNAGAIFCFAPETKVRLADGSEVPITDVKVGDKVLCPHEDGTESEETVLHTMEPHYNDVWNLVCKDGVDTHYVMATTTQPLLTEDKGFVEIGNMTLGTNLKGRGKVVNMVYSGERKVYDLHVSGDNNYYADGFIAKGGSTDNWVKEDN